MRDSLPGLLLSFLSPGGEWDRRAASHEPPEQQRAAGRAAGHGGAWGFLSSSPSPGVGTNAAIHFPLKLTPLSDLNQSLIPQLSTFSPIV